MKTFSIISLGCPKNLVDSETFCYIADKHGYELSYGYEGLDFILINTCSFIQSAISELEKTLKIAVEHKAMGDVKRIFVTGCIMKRRLSIVQKKFPAIDAWIDLKDYQKFESLISQNHLNQYFRYPLADGPYSYLKISDGCNNKCSYCTIPSIRGKLKSQSIEDLVREATYLANTGAKELIIIAQDTTSYGIDLYKEKILSELLKRLHDVPGYIWLRLMYLHPKNIKKELIKTIATLPKIVHAFEMPLQHCNDDILRHMNRNYTKKDIINIYNMFMEEMPDTTFRTTFITGFPGESRDKFNELKKFITDYKFLRMGVFEYSLEGDTPALYFPDKVSETTARKRKNELLDYHRQLSEKYLAEYIGKEVDVLIEEAYPEEDDFYGRAYFDVPDIDGFVNFTGKGADYGDFVKVRIDDVIAIDLYGKLTQINQKYDFEEV